MDISICRIDHLLKVYADQLRATQVQTSRKTMLSHTVPNEFGLSAEGKRKQFIEQLVAEAVAQLTAHVSIKNSQKIF